jgi:hypothetical protein
LNVEPRQDEADTSPWAFAVILVAIVAIMALVALGAEASGVLAAE